jgi:hypothetical protein
MLTSFSAVAASIAVLYSSYVAVTSCKLTPWVSAMTWYCLTCSLARSSSPLTDRSSFLRRHEDELPMAGRGAVKGKDSPKLGNGGLQLLLRRLRRVSGAVASLVHGQLLLLRFHLQGQVTDALFEVTLRRLGGDELFARAAVLGSLRRSPGQRGVAGQNRMFGAGRTKRSMRSWNVFASISRRRAVCRALSDSALIFSRKSALSKTTSGSDSLSPCNQNTLGDLRLRLQTSNVLLEPAASVVAAALELVLHRLQVPHEIGQVRAFL